MRKNLLINCSIVILSVIFIAWIISCAVNPVTGKKEFMLVSESQEIALGKQTDQQVIETYGLYNNQQLNNYVNVIGQKMAKLSHRPNLSFSFKVLDTGVINAFAVPGGFIYVTRGILAYLNNEAELAGVLGHEIGHVTARHTAKQVSKSQVAQLGLGIGSMLSETFQKYAGMAQFGVGMLFLKFSRDNERQADALGVEYSSKASFDANHMANFFGTLNRLHPASEGAGLPDWFSTHPNPPDRIKAVKRDAQKWQANLTQKQFFVNRNNFLNKVNGIIYGADPRQGYVEGNAFYHPQMRFYFPVPAGWQVNNTPSQVQMFTEKQDAAILFSLSKSSSPKSAADQFISETKAVTKSSNQIRVNGLLAHQIVADVPQEGKESIPIISTYIQMDNKVYAFLGLSNQAQFNGFLPTFKNTMNKFKKLTDRRKINVKPAKIVIKKTRQRQTLRQIFQKFKVPSDKFEEMAILNGRQLNDNIPANTLIKIVSK